MTTPSPHTFHIPVMGLGFTIDSPAKVAHLGISSVVSIVEDHLIENMRKVICEKYLLPYAEIKPEEQDSRARRITAYLNTLKEVVDINTERMRKESFIPGSDICKYFEMLPEESSAKQLYNLLPSLGEHGKTQAEEELRALIAPGTIDVNIMTKVDRAGYDENGEPLPEQYSDALSALRGFAKSNLNSSVIFSAGLNPRLYSYCEAFDDFFPDENGNLKKSIILKVSDYRSALIQGKFLAKKGIWISEFRIESGLNCGGHAFATQGILFGPILEEFKAKRNELSDELYTVYSAALQAKQKLVPAKTAQKITAQGGLGTAEEDRFLMHYYQLDATGWGSPFLLVPEATNVDKETLDQLASAKQDDYFLSHSSPLGVPFNNFRPSTSEKQRKKRIEKNRPGSPCYKKFLSSNTEFTEKPICTASREFQNLKIKQLQSTMAPGVELDKAIDQVTEKDCLCEGLGSSALLVNNQKPSHKLTAVSICPGPNLAFFSGIHTLKEMVDHIYGRCNLLNSLLRPHMFMNELQLYVDYLRTEIEKSKKSITDKQVVYFDVFRKNLIEGINYYKKLATQITSTKNMQEEMNAQLDKFSRMLSEMIINRNMTTSLA